MSYTVVIRRNADAVEASYECPCEWRDGEDGESDQSGSPDWYWWHEGNQSCDCNRVECFARARGEVIPSERECSNGLYSIIRFELPDGRVFVSPESVSEGAKTS